VVHGPDPRIAAGRVTDVVLCRVTIGQRAQVKRMTHAAHLMFDREQNLARAGIDDVFETVLMFVALLLNESAFKQSAVRSREIRDADLDVMAVVWGQEPIGLAKAQFLARAETDPRQWRCLVLEDSCRRRHYLTVKVHDSVDASRRHVGLDVENAEGDLAEALVGFMTAYVVAPRAEVRAGFYDLHLVSAVSGALSV